MERGKREELRERPDLIAFKVSPAY
jgi:hypothetical protein